MGDTIRLRDRVTGLISEHPADRKDDLLAWETEDGPRYEAVPEGKEPADFDRERDEAASAEQAKWRQTEARKAAKEAESKSGK